MSSLQRHALSPRSFHTVQALETAQIRRQREQQVRGRLYAPRMHSENALSPMLDHGDYVFDIAEGINTSQLPARTLVELRRGLGIGARPARDALGLDEERQLARDWRPHVGVQQPVHEQRPEVLLGSPAESDELVNGLPVAGRVPPLQDGCVRSSPMPSSGRGLIRRAPSALPLTEPLGGFHGCPLHVASPRGSPLEPRSDVPSIGEIHYLRPIFPIVSSRRLFGPHDSCKLPLAPLVAASALSHVGPLPIPIPRSSLHLAQRARITTGALTPHPAGQVFVASSAAESQGTMPDDDARSSWGRRLAAGGMATVAPAASPGAGNAARARESPREWSRGLAWLNDATSDGTPADLHRGHTGPQGMPSHHLAVRHAGGVGVQASYGTTRASSPISISILGGTVRSDITVPPPMPEGSSHLSGEAGGDISEILDLLNVRPSGLPQLHHVNVGGGQPVGQLRSLSLPPTTSRGLISGTGAVHGSLHRQPTQR